MMTDCSSSFHGSTTSSSDLNSHHGCGSATASRIRSIKLVRPHTSSGNNNSSNQTNLIGHPPFSSFGFSIRGGREFSTGFFVSSVLKGSEADLKGLQVRNCVQNGSEVNGNRVGMWIVSSRLNVMSANAKTE